MNNINYRSVSCFFVLMLLVGCGGSSGGGESNSSSKGGDILTALEAYYPFTGNTNDISGNALHATGNTGAMPTTDKNGNENSAYLFDGIDDAITIPVNINPDVMPQLTMTAWVRSDDGEGVVISHDRLEDTTGYERTLGIDFRGGGTGWSAFAGSEQVLGFIPVAIGEWTFLAIVYDQDVETVRVYVNDQTFSGTGFLYEALPDTTIGTNPGFAVFSSSNYFEGVIDEVRIYSRVLTQDDISSLKNL